MNNIDKLQKSINQLEEIVSNLVEERNALQAENKKLKEQQLTEGEIRKIENNLLYNFPQRSYTNSMIIAYQYGLNKLAKAIIKAREEKIKPPEPPKGRLIKDGKIEKGR